MDDELSNGAAGCELGELFERLRFSEELQGENSSNLATLKKENEDLKSDLMLLKGLLIHQDDEIKQLKEAVRDLTSRSMQHNILVHGIPEQAEGNNNEDCCRLVAEAISKHGLQDIPAMERAHRLGAFNKNVNKSRPRPIVARFTSQKSADDLLAFGKTLLRGKGGIKLTPHFPTDLHERRRFLGEKIALLKKSNGADPVNFKLIKDKLYINGELQPDPLPRPTARDLLTATPAERESAMKEAPKVHEGSSVMYRGTTITAALAPVSNINDARKAYKKILFSRPAAAHSIAVFRLASNSSDKLTEGWQDDGAHGAGRYLRFLLSRKKKENVAVFITVGSPLAPLGQNGFRALEESLSNII